MSKHKQVNISWLKDRVGATEGGDDGIFATMEGQTAEVSRERRVMLVDPKYLEDSPYQHRQVYRNVESLAEKIKRHKFKGSIPVRFHPHKPGFYQIVFGHRRYRAAIMAGMHLIPIEVDEYSDEEMLLLSISENQDREDLTPLEEGNGFLQLNEEFGMSQEDIAAYIGEEKKERIDRGFVRNRIRAAKLARKYAAVKQLLEEQPTISLRAVGYLEDEQLREQEVLFLLERLKQDQWTADNVAAAVKIFKTGGEVAESLLTSKALAPASSANGHEQDALPETVMAPAPAPSEEPPESWDARNAIKRTGQVTDALKRMQRYNKMIGEAAPSEDERVALAAMIGLIQLILARS
jgi:ParB/RepB/Spo0J family partition protein